MSDEFNKIKKAILDREKLKKHEKYNFVGTINYGLKSFQDVIDGSKGGLYGYLDENDHIIINANYIDAKDFSDGLAPVAKMIVNEKIVNSLDDSKSIFVKLLNVLGKDSDLREQKKIVSKELKYGYIDLNNNIMIDFIFDEAFSFSEGYAVVRLNDTWLLIDKSYQKSIKIEADRVNFPCLLKNGKLSVQKNEKTIELDLLDII